MVYLGPWVSGGCIFTGQPAGNLSSAHQFFHVLPKDAAHDLRFRFVDFRPAVLSDPVPVRDGPVGHASLLGSTALSHSRALSEGVQFNLSGDREKGEVLHVDGVLDGFQLDPVGFHHLHEGGGGEHPLGKPVQLPADNYVERAQLGVDQHPLELGAVLGPAPAHILVASLYGKVPVPAVCFHVADLFGQ